MNPYDFVRINFNTLPNLEKPVWHHQLARRGDTQLYAGQIELNVYAETPLFIFGKSQNTTDMQNGKDERTAASSLQNMHGDYIIPGSSLKGMLRCLVETLGNGCLTLFDGNYERSYEAGREAFKAPYISKIHRDFRRCHDNTQLCIACRIFGMMRPGKDDGDGRDDDRGSGNGSSMFLGKVNISDARAYQDTVRLYDPIFTEPLVTPKPHHRAFYLDEAEQYIAGRKYYFHHRPQQLLTMKEFHYFGKSQEPANYHIQPLDIDTKFHFSIDFNQLTRVELSALLLALTLESDMRHKIGYGKPLGLGSIYLEATSFTLVDYSTRYTQLAQGEHQKALPENNWSLYNELAAEFYQSQYQLVPDTIDDLEYIWHWHPDTSTDYYYPSKNDWFNWSENRRKRIAETANVPRQSYGQYRR